MTANPTVDNMHLHILIVFFVCFPLQEMEDFFYYCQLRNQGIDSMETRQVSARIPLAEVSFVMRALGFFPTEQEVHVLKLETNPSLTLFSIPL